MYSRTSGVRSFFTCVYLLFMLVFVYLADLYEFPTHGGVRSLLGLVNFLTHGGVRPVFRTC